MAITDFGKAVRKARIEAEVSLASMAAALETTPAFLSAMETGRKKIPEAWVKKVQDYFAQFGIQLGNLPELADVANKSVSLEGLSPAQQMAVAGFARRNMDDAQLEHFLKLLGAAKRS
jgi:transcriptional regulator with XRE-family HTH domain